MVPEVWSTTDRIFCHFGPFFALSPPMDLEIQNFEKKKKMPGYIIIVHMCIINDNHHMVPEIWSMKDNFLPLGTFAFLPPYGPRIIKILKK